MAMSRWFWRGVFLVLATAWGWLMVVVGLLLITDWAVWTGPYAGLGVGLIAVGEFIFAIVADWLFPRADRRLSGTFEVAAWVAAITAIGMWLLG